MSESHFYQALKQISGTNPPDFMKKVTTDEYINNFGDDENDMLVDWAISSSNIPWATGQGLIDAAVSLTQDAACNGNISEASFPVDDLCLSGGKHSFHSFGGQKVRRCNNCSCLEF